MLMLNVQGDSWVILETGGEFEWRQITGSTHEQDMRWVCE